MRMYKIKIIPVIVTINGWGNKQSVEDLKEIDIEINWKKVIKDIIIIIRNMQDVMFYNGVNMDFKDVVNDS